MRITRIIDQSRQWKRNPTWIRQFIAVLETLYLLTFDTIIHDELLYFKCLRYRILFSVCSDSKLEVDLNTQCQIKRILNDDDISQHQKNKFYNLDRSFYKRAFKYALNNLPHSDEILKHVGVINWEHRKFATIDSLFRHSSSWKFQSNN